MTQEHKDFLIFLGQKYNKKPFSLEEAKKYITEEERFTKEDFKYYWQNSFTGTENGFIKRDNNKKDFILTYKALKLLPKKEKIPWTHGEIISLIGIIFSGLGIIISNIVTIFTILRS